MIPYQTMGGQNLGQIYGAPSASATAVGGGGWWTANPPPTFNRQPAAMPGILASLGQPVSSPYQFNSEGSGGLSGKNDQPGGSTMYVGNYASGPLLPGQIPVAGSNGPAPPPQGQPSPQQALGNWMLRNAFQRSMGGSMLPWIMQPGSNLGNLGASQGGGIQMRAPNGDTGYVHPDQVNHYMGMGATRL